MLRNKTLEQIINEWSTELESHVKTFTEEAISDEPSPENPRESTLRKEVSQLKRLLAEKTVELDFFKGALQKVEAQHQPFAERPIALEQQDRRD